METETSPAYKFRSSQGGYYGNIRVRHCQHCDVRTKQKQAHDENRKWVEKYRCQNCSTETA
jgi:hypothetical protein